MGSGVRGPCPSAEKESLASEALDKNCDPQLNFFVFFKFIYGSSPFLQPKRLKVQYSGGREFITCSDFGCSKVVRLLNGSDLEWSGPPKHVTRLDR